MDIKGRQKNNIIILDLFGRIDVNSANFVEVVGRCVHDGYTDVLCNFAGVDIIDYMGISVIVIAYKEVVNNEGRMKFTNVPAHLQGILSIAGLDKAIDVYVTEDLAIASFKEDKIIEDIKKMQLRRRFKRLPIGIKVDILSRNPNGPQCFNVDVCNLSALGAYIWMR